MHPHPDQLTPQEAADAVGALAGVHQRLMRLTDKISQLTHAAERELPILAAAAESDGTERANYALAEEQVRTADLAVEILSAMDLLADRMAKAHPALQEVLGKAAAAETEAVSAAFFTEHFGKAA